jgi:hypothetical protein
MKSTSYVNLIDVLKNSTENHAIHELRDFLSKTQKMILIKKLHQTLHN